MGKWKTVFTNKVTGNEETKGEANKRQNKEHTAIEKNLILFFAMHFPIQGQ